MWKSTLQFILSSLGLDMKNFKQLRIWQKAYEISTACYQLVKTFDPLDRYGLGNQILRASVSIASNIAEGSSRDSQKDYLRFMGISLGSSFELETQLLIAHSSNTGDQHMVQKILPEVINVQKMIVGFQQSLKESLRGNQN